MRFPLGTGLAAALSAATLAAAPAEGALAGGPACGATVAPIAVGAARMVGLGAHGEQASALREVGLRGGVQAETPGQAQGGGSPPTIVCKVDEADMTVVLDRASGVAVRATARRNRDTLTVFVQVAASADHGTFQAAWLQNGAGRREARELAICGLWEGSDGRVDWTRPAWSDPRPAAGSATPAGATSSSEHPDGLWRRLGFSNASYGARAIALTFRMTPAEAAGSPVDLVVHITRPGDDPVTTVPLTMRLAEGPAGVSLTVPGKLACAPAA